MTTIEVAVRPNAGKFSIRRDAPGKYRVGLSEAAEKGKANQELIKELSRRLGAPVRLLRGGRSRKKLLEVGIDGPDIETRLAASE